MMIKRKSELGFGLIEVLVGFAVLAVSISIAMDLLSHTFTGQARTRQANILRKSFGGAEMALIDQRQCRCNLIKTTIPIPVANSAQIAIVGGQLSTFWDVDSCTFNATTDEVLADTTSSQNINNRSLYTILTQWQTIVPLVLYRALLVVAPPNGASVQFPILIHGHPNTSGTISIDSCGVDRAS